MTDSFWGDQSHDYFSNDHVLNVGIQGSLGPAVSPWEMVQQNFRQQWHVDSALALNNELGNRWEESLTALRAAGQNFNPAQGPEVYRAYADFVRNGTPAPDYYTGGLPSTHDEFENIRRANEAIHRLNNPQIKTFEQILDEVSQMQQGIEHETASMSERASGFANVIGMAGSIAGSFTLRDPLNVVTAPIGFGRTIATRIATDMAVAGATTAVTEYTDVQPNRQIAGLPERSAIGDIVAATLGAGLIRGGIEGVGAGVRALHGRVVPEIDFDLRDAQLQQMFVANDHSPTARAAGTLLDDTIVFEHSNPYGDGMVAGYRWQAELEATAHALNGEPTPHVELPPIPSEFIDRQLSFQSVKETAPELWNELETARTRLADLDNNITEATSRELSIPDAVRLVDEEAAAKLDQLSEIVNDPTIPEPTRAAADTEAQATILRVGQDRIMKAVEVADTKTKFEVQNLRASRKAANKAYRAAYQKVEREAERLEQAEAARHMTAQTEAIHVLAPSVVTEPMTGPMTRFDFVEAHGAKVDAAEASQPARADAVNGLEVSPEGTVDIGTKTPVSVDFKVPFEDGELSVRQILDDLAEDQRLEEAMKVCSI